MAGIISRFVLQLPVLIIVIVAVAASSLYLTTVGAAVVGFLLGLVTAGIVSLISKSLVDET